MNNTPNNDQINEFVKQLIYTNKAVWDAICATGDLSKNDVYNFLINNEDEDNEVSKILKKIAKIFKEKSADSELAKPDYNGENFENFEGLADRINKYLK